MAPLGRRLGDHIALNKAGDQGVDKVLFERPGNLRVNNEVGLGFGEAAGLYMQVLQPARHRWRSSDDPTVRWRDEVLLRYRPAMGNESLWVQGYCAPAAAARCPLIHSLAKAMKHDIAGPNWYSGPCHLQIALGREGDEGERRREPQMGDAGHTLLGT